MDERYGSARSQDVADVDWIRDAAAQGEVLLSKDRAIARRPLEAEAIYYNEARVFVIASAQITGPEMLSRVIGNASAIERIGGQHGPFVFAIYEASVARLRLNYP
jgi:hypothetical protein